MYKDRASFLRAIETGSLDGGIIDFEFNGNHFHCGIDSIRIVEDLIHVTIWWTALEINRCIEKSSNAEFQKLELDLNNVVYIEQCSNNRWKTAFRHNVKMLECFIQPKRGQLAMTLTTLRGY